MSISIRCDACPRSGKWNAFVNLLIHLFKKNLFSNCDLEGITLSTRSTSGRTNEVGEHLLSTCYVPDTITHQP